MAGKEPGGPERWARGIVQETLQVPVSHHDDGSKPSMYDLCAYLGETIAAIEVVAAADPDAVELWNLMNGNGRWIDNRLSGGWAVTVNPRTRWNGLRSSLPELLLCAEQSGITQIRPQPDRLTTQLDGDAAALGVQRASQSGTDYPGSIYPTFAPTAGFSDSGTTLVSWIAQYLRQPATRDVLDKLRASGADERHAFVFVPGFSTAPLPVEMLLVGSHPGLPVDPPDLPDPVTHVWVASTWTSPLGLRWGPEGWLHFDKLVVRPA